MALTIIGDNLLYAQEYGRLCAVLAIPVQDSEYRVIYLMGEGGRFTALKQRLNLEGILVKIAPVQLRKALKEEYERSLEIRRAM